TINGYQLAQSWLEDWQQQIPSTTQVPQLWTGMEITAELLGSEVHILGYAFDPEHPALHTYLQGSAPQNSEAKAESAIIAIHQAGGLAVLAHPARYRRSAKELIPLAAELGIDGVETYYAYANPKPWQPSQKQTQQVKQLSASYNLLNTCGTDTHGLSLLQRL
ncbi:MAG: PHP domain-containing protein, partial [Merismopedia sp. SIO2A8]|nr:PHP domain-containing protein [Merismopedia sp. SIO2A8]